MSETYDIISEHGPIPHTGWEPMFPNRKDRWSELDRPMIVDIAIANVISSPAAWSLAYGDMFDEDATATNMVTDKVRFNAINLEGNSTIIVTVRWPFPRASVQAFCKSSVASALTFLAVGVRGGP